VDERFDDRDDTVVRPRAPVSPGPRDVSDRDAPDLDDTIIRLIEPSIEPSVEPLQLTASVAPASTSVAWSMRVRGTTAIVPLDVPVVVGRRPGPPRPYEQPPPRRLVIPAAKGDVSARHARIEQLGDSLVVVDLGSTNGVVVHWSTGASLRLRPGESCAVLPDAIILLGDGVEIEFVARTFPHTPQPSEPS